MSPSSGLEGNDNESEHEQFGLSLSSEVSVLSVTAFRLSLEANSGGDTYGTVFTGPEQTDGSPRDALKDHIG